jgi:hypothetical protein
VTICAAAICTVYLPTGSEAMLLGISDRMLTSGDIEFESPHSKMIGFPLPAQALCFGAGESTWLHTIATEVRRETEQTGITETADIARLYADTFANRRRERAERLYLAPHGLNTATFVRNQHKMNPDLVLMLCRRLEEYDLGIEVIVVGRDSSGLHIYHVGDPGVATCHDGIGFCAIGSGARQLESQLMYMGYGRSCHWLDAFLLMYSAKKKAEVSPGVGEATDMLMATAAGVNFYPDEHDYLRVIDEYHKELEDLSRKNRNEILVKMAKDSRLGYNLEQSGQKSEVPHVAPDGPENDKPGVSPPNPVSNG